MKLFPEDISVIVMARALRCSFNYNNIGQMEKTTGQHYDYWLPPSGLEHAESGGFYYKEVERPRES